MKIEKNKSLRSLNTFGIEAAAKYFVEIRSAGEFRELCRDAAFIREKKLILGGGSNILLTGDFDGWVVKNSIPGISIAAETDGEVTVKAGAGENWHDLVMWSIERDYAGLENLSLIPGLTGAAPIQNIGAYGAEQKDVFGQLEAIEIGSGEAAVLKAGDCAFGYRDSIFKHQWENRFFITSVSFKLAKLSSPNTHYRYRTEYGNVRAMLDEMKAGTLSLKVMSDAICRIRRAKLPDPKEIGNAGSFFKNPSIPQAQFKELVLKYPEMPHYPQEDGRVKVPAGWLIEQCGWKGKRAGRAGCHKTQALVLVNYGGATGREVLEFAESIRGSVAEKFGIELSCEVNII